MGLNKLKPTVIMAISNPKSDSHSLFGRGIAELCRGVRETGSLNAAAKNMHMAYSKAWRIIKDTEEALGVRLLDRDGAHGSTLTADGERLIEIYDKLQADIQAKAEAAYAKLV